MSLICRLMLKRIGIVATHPVMGLKRAIASPVQRSSPLLDAITPHNDPHFKSFSTGSMPRISDVPIP